MIDTFARLADYYCSSNRGVFDRDDDHRSNMLFGMVVPNLLNHFGYMYDDDDGPGRRRRQLEKFISRRICHPLLSDRMKRSLGDGSR